MVYIAAYSGDWGGFTAGDEIEGKNGQSEIGAVIASGVMLWVLGIA